MANRTRPSPVTANPPLAAQVADVQQSIGKRWREIAATGLGDPDEVAKCRALIVALDELHAQGDG